jgi:hypothetical protein
MKTFTQDPIDRQDYDCRLISDDGDTVATTDLPTITPSGGLVQDGVDISGAVAKLWLKTGTDEIDYEILLPMHSTNGRVKAAKFIVQVRR